MATNEAKKQSRRARRRAARDDAEQNQALSDESMQAVDRDSGVDSDGEEEAAAAAPDSGASSRGEEGGERPKSTRKKKKTRRAAASAPDAEESLAEIKDKNRRLRAAAAARRRAKRTKERDVAQARGLDASEMVDDALARGTHAATRWLKRNITTVQWVVVLGVAGAIGWQIYAWRRDKNIEKASDALAVAVQAELGRVGNDAPPPGQEDLITTPSFETDEARLQAAAKAYDEAAKIRSGSGTAILAQLGLAGIRYEQEKYDEAITAYEAVKSSPLATHDQDVLCRSIEGIGLSHEAKGDLDKALTAFKELGKVDAPGIATLALYHQARVTWGKKDKEGAKKLLEKAQEKFAKERATYPAGSYLDKAMQTLMAILDPSKAGPSETYTPEQLEALKAQVMKDPGKLQDMLKDMQNQVKDLTDQLPKEGDLPLPTPTGSGQP